MTLDSTHRVETCSPECHEEYLPFSSILEKQCKPEKRSEDLSYPNVLNLSKRDLSQTELETLSLGLKFVPSKTPKRNDLIKAGLDLNRRLALKAFWRHRSSKTRKPFTSPSGWTPHPGQIPNYVKEAQLEILAACKSQPIVPSKKNLTKIQLKHLQNLQQDKTIIIKPADKGSANVIQNTSDYLIEGQCQLNKKQHYKLLKDPLQGENAIKINAILNKIQEKGLLDQKQFNHLKAPSNPRERIMYLLPKIHKSKDTWSNNIPPGRPIISNVASESYLAAQYVTSFLAPLSKSHPSYIKDTYDFLERIKFLKVPNNVYLCSLDIEGMYTNIDNIQGIQAIKELFSNNPDPSRPDKEILDLLDIMLNNNVILILFLF